MPGASNKVFEYLADGLAVLVSDLPGWREIVVDNGYELACVAEEARSIACAISWWLAHPEEMPAVGERGRARIATSSPAAASRRATWHSSSSTCTTCLNSRQPSTRSSVAKLSSTSPTTNWCCVTSMVASRLAASCICAVRTLCIRSTISDE